MFIWIIRDGVRLVYKSFLDIPINKDLISGLLTAINTFVISEFNQPIDSIDMGGLNWVYDYDEETYLLFVAADVKEVNPDTLKSRVHYIKQMFLGDYRALLESGEWKGEMAIFIPFEEKVVYFYNNWQAAENLGSFADLFDILAIFQQLLNLINNIIEKQINNSKKNKIIAELEDFTSKFKERLDIVKTGEVNKITYSAETGFDVFGIDPSKCDIHLVKKLLMNYLANVLRILKDTVGSELSLIYFKEQKIFPYVFSNMSLLKKHDLQDYLLQNLLIV